MSELGEPKLIPVETSEHVNEEFETDEFRKRQAQKLIRLLSIASNVEAFHGRKLGEIFSSQESIAKFILDLKPEEYIELLEGLNGIIRNKDPQTWAADGQKVEIGNWTFPPQKDKVELLYESLKVAKQMLLDGRDIIEVAYLLSVTVTACHLFNNGNGRTSRMVFMLIARGFRSKDMSDMVEFMSTSGEESKLTDPSRLYGLIKNKLCLELWLNWNDLSAEGYPVNYLRQSMVIPSLVNLSDINKERILELLEGDRFYFIMSLLDFNKETLESVKDDSGEIDILKLLILLNDSNVENFYSNIDKIKIKYVQSIFDCIQNPDKAGNFIVLKSHDGTSRKQNALDILKSSRIGESSKKLLFGKNKI